MARGQFLWIVNLQERIMECWPFCVYTIELRYDVLRQFKRWFGDLAPHVCWIGWQLRCRRWLRSCYGMMFIIFGLESSYDVYVLILELIHYFFFCIIAWGCFYELNNLDEFRWTLVGSRVYDLIEHRNGVWIAESVHLYCNLLILSLAVQGYRAELWLARLVRPRRRYRRRLYFSCREACRSFSPTKYK